MMDKDTLQEELSVCMKNAIVNAPFPQAGTPALEGLIAFMEENSVMAFIAMPQLTAAMAQYGEVLFKLVMAYRALGITIDMEQKPETPFLKSLFEKENQ